MTDKKKTVACKRPSQPETPDERRARLARRRLRQLARQPGFTPVRNARVDSAIQSQVALLVMSGAYNAVEAHHEATRRVARMLPQAPMVRSYARRPSKSDDPEYRRGNR